jgi:hypothetical protein
MNHNRLMPSFVALCMLAILFPAAGQALALRRIMPRGGGQQGAGTVSLPYVINDSAGNQWTIYQGGWMQQQGNTPIFGQAAMLTINGNQPQMNNNTARVDESGELVMENLPVANGITVTRRVLANDEDGYIRYLEVIKNAGGQDQTLDLQLQSNVNYGVQAAQIVDDAKRKGQQLAWVAQTDGGRAAIEVYAGKGSKLAPTIRWQQGNNNVSASMKVTIPAGKEVSIMHLHGTSASMDSGVEWVAALKENKLVAELPRELRRTLANFVTGQQLIGERELLRGELLDVIELRGGDQVRGTLKEPSFQLQTFYGDVTLPVERVVGIINVGDFRPRQLVVTLDGEVFGGKLNRETIALELSSGQVTQVPLSQIARVGYRRRTGEPEEWKFDKPFVMLRSGDRVSVAMPEQPIEVVTRYGLMKLDPKSIAAITFESDEHGVHEIQLTDGSRFAGLASAPQYVMKLAGAGSAAEQAVTFPASSMAQLRFAGEPEEPSDTTPTLQLVNEDLLVGSLAGKLALDTAFDTLSIEAAEIRALAHAPGGGTDVQITLWDQSVLSGQLQDGQLQCNLKSGVSVTVPVALVERYEQPEPQPAASMVERVKAAVAELNAEDWKQRDRAEAELKAMGPVVAPVLKSLRAAQPPEAQQRIDQILTAIAKKK